MTTLTIPKDLIKNDDLVIIPRRKYEELLRNSKLKKGKYTQLDRILDESVKEVRQGKFKGPFSSLKDFRISIEK